MAERRSRSRSRSGDRQIPLRFELNGPGSDYYEILFEEFPEWRKDLSVFLVLASCLNSSVDVVSYRFDDENRFQFVLKHTNGVERQIQFTSTTHRIKIDALNYTLSKMTRLTDQRIHNPFQLSQESILIAVNEIHRLVYKFINVLVAEGKLEDLRIFNVPSNVTNKDMGPVSEKVLQFVKGSFRKDPIKSRF